MDTATAILIFGNVIRALVFDFDGLILDTEEPVYRSWLEVYQAHGEELPFERWVQIVGSTTTGFHPQHHLEERLGRPLPQEVLAIEDSPNGVMAAKQAGMLCVAIPNTITARLDLTLADLMLTSLAEVSLTELVRRLERPGTS